MGGESPEVILFYVSSIVNNMKISKVLNLIEGPTVDLSLVKS